MDECDVRFQNKGGKFSSPSRVAVLCRLVALLRSRLRCQRRAGRGFWGEVLSHGALSEKPAEEGRNAWARHDGARFAQDGACSAHNANRARPCDLRRAVAQAGCGCRNAFWMGPSRVLPNVPSQRGAEAKRVASPMWTIITAPTKA